MTTAREMARKIHRGFHEGTQVRGCSPGCEVEIAWAESLIEKALADVRKESLDELTHYAGRGIVPEKWVKQIQADAYEEAAKATESVEHICPDYDNVLNATSCLRSNIAARIRGLGK